MEKTGIVISSKNEYVEVSVTRDSACGDSCAACGLCSNSREMRVTLKNTLGLKPGDKVRLISDDKKVLRHSATGYLSLTALLIAGGVLGGVLGGDWAAFLGAILGLFVGIRILRMFFTKSMEITVKKLED